jgi:hypothetical protein
VKDGWTPLSIGEFPKIVGYKLLRGNVKFLCDNGDEHSILPRSLGFGKRAVDHTHDEIVYGLKKIHERFNIDRFGLEPIQ